MPPITEPDPGATALEHFGYELRRLREEAGLTQDDLGSMISYSPAQVSAIENAKRNPKKDFATGCDTALKTGTHFTDLWREVRRAVHRPVVRSYFELEQKATCIQTFETINVPGLLQTEEYTRALMRGGSFRDGEERIEARAAERVDRQEILHRDDPPVLFAVIDEVVLHRPIGGPTVMHEQLRHLITTAALPGIMLQVIPSSVGAHPGADGPIVLMSFAEMQDIAWIDHAAGGSVVDRPEDVARLAYRFDALRAEALPQSTSIDLIEKVIQQWI